MSLAVYRVRGGLAAGQIVNGPWATAKTYGTTDASALVRAQVALAGLLALPAKEAMYFTARTDSAGRPLNGKCTYRISGTPIEARWWSITLYRGEGWLVPNAENKWSVGGGSVGDVWPGNLPWWMTVSPRYAAGPWIPTGGIDRFDLTLRAYHPSPALLNSPESATLPTIILAGCK